MLSYFDSGKWGHITDYRNISVCSGQPFVRAFFNLFLLPFVRFEHINRIDRFFFEEEEECYEGILVWSFSFKTIIGVRFQSICATGHGSRTTRRIWWRAPMWDDIVSFTVHPQRRRGAASSPWRVTLPPVPERLIVILCRGRSISRRTVGIISNCIYFSLNWKFGKFEKKIIEEFGWLGNCVYDRFVVSAKWFKNWKSYD